VSMTGETQTGSSAEGSVQVRLETELGDIVLAIDTAHAPATSANFLRYVAGGFYDGGRFHRTVKPDNQPNNDVRIEVIQASINPNRVADAFPSIPLERTTVTGLTHTDGTVSMARFAVDSANYDFFICIGDQPELNFGGKRYTDGQGFAAFGHVISGHNIVRAIQQSPVQAQKLTPPILIVRASQLS
jgi:peptidyl-prolyl cis-trans isomerase A (cyclophilin A)